MPFKPHERIYRDFSVSNLNLARNEERESEEPSYVVRGHYTVFDAEYPLFPDFYESIDSRALDETDMSDVIFQVDHSDTPLARLRNKSLRLGIDEVGGWCEADLSGSQRGRDIYEAISNGLIDRMSFGFTIADDGFEWDEDEDGVIHSRITKIDRLYDVSAVTWPASEHTDISARSYVDAAIEAQREKERIERESQVEPKTPEQEPETTDEQPEAAEEPTEEPAEDEPIVIDGGEIDATTIMAGTITVPYDAITTGPIASDTDNTIDFEQAMEQRRSLRKRRARALQLIN